MFEGNSQEQHIIGTVHCEMKEMELSQERSKDIRGLLKIYARLGEIFLCFVIICFRYRMCICVEYTKYVFLSFGYAPFT